MDIIQCSLCKKPFMSYGSKICTKCLEEMDESFIKVRDFLDDNPGAGMDMVVEKTEVPRRVIMHLLKEGRLIMSTGESGSTGVLRCEACKKPISTGKLCGSCKDKLASTMQNNISGSKSSGSSRNEARDNDGAAKIGKYIKP